MTPKCKAICVVFLTFVLGLAVGYQFRDSRGDLNTHSDPVLASAAKPFKAEVSAPQSALAGESKKSASFKIARSVEETVDSEEKLSDEFEGQLILTFGEMGQVGREAGILFRQLDEFAVVDPSKMHEFLSDPANGLVKRLTEFYTISDELALIDQNPKDASQYQSGFLSEALGLEDGFASAKLEPFFTSFYEDSKARGFLLSNRPKAKELEERWYEMRQIFYDEHLDEFKSLLPTSAVPYLESLMDEPLEGHVLDPISLKLLGG